MLSETNRLFNPKAPYDSFINFTNRHELLLDHQKKEFLEEVEDFFSKCAYKDELLRTDESLSERMIKYDMPTLERVATQLNWPEGKHRITQLLANIAKVIQITLSQNRSFYEFRFVEKYREFGLISWGWIPANYVNSSAKLSACIKEGGQQLNAKPSIPLALQRFQAYTSNKDAKTIVLDLSFEALLDLLVFADEWEVTSLLDDLNELFHQVNIEKLKPEEYERAVKGYNKQKLDKALQNMHHRELKRFRLEDQKVIFPFYEDGQETSCWFKNETPYESIIRFSARCCALSKTEQLRFCSAVRGFFTRAAYRNHIDVLSTAEKGKFTQIALPFLLGTMQHTECERLRLIACIRLVANQQLLLGERDRVCMIENNYGTQGTAGPTKQIGWVPASDVRDSARTEDISLSLPAPMPLSGKGKDVEQLLKSLAIPWPETTRTENIKKALAEIKQCLADKSRRTEISTELAKLLHYTDVCTTLSGINLSNFCPNMDALTLEQQTTFFNFLLEREGKPLPLMIKERLQSTPHLAEILKIVVKKSDLNAKTMQSVAHYFLSKILEKVPSEHFAFARQMCHVGMNVFDTTDWGAELKQIVAPELLASTFVEKFFPYTEGTESPFVSVFKELMLIQDIKPGQARKIGKQFPLSKENALIGWAILKQCESWLKKSAPQIKYFYLEVHYRYAYLDDEDIRTLNDVADIQASQANWMVEFIQRTDVKELFRGYKLSNAYLPLLETMKRIPQAAPLAEVFVEKFTKHLTLESWRKCLKEMFELICKRNHNLSMESLRNLSDKYEMPKYPPCEKFMVKGCRLVNEPNVKEWINSQVGASIQAAMSKSFNNATYCLDALIEVDVFIDKIQGRFKDPARYELLRKFLEDERNFHESKEKSKEEYTKEITGKIVKLLIELTPEGLKEIQAILKDSEAVSLLTKNNLPNLIKLLREHLVD